jgi:hypothetical protein
MNLLKLISLKTIAMIVLATSSFTVAPIVTATEKRQLTNEEQEYIYGLIREIESVFDFFKVRLDIFFDRTDKSSYRDFVNSLCKEIDQFYNDSMKPLEYRIENYADKDEPFYKGLVVVHELLVEFLDKLHAMRLVLYKYVSVTDTAQAMEIAVELKPHLEALISKDVWDKLETKLGHVESLMNQIEDRDIMTKLASLKVLLKKTRSSSSAVKVTPTAFVACLTRKIRNNKAH